MSDTLSKIWEKIDDGEYCQHDDQTPKKTEDDLVCNCTGCETKPLQA